ncbi:MAG TPA: EF-hand domain-containing protein [Gemmataceae bacterium]|nr:EF-hand domain-containing protein [Gemmataceae bacterium]
MRRLLPLTLLAAIACAARAADPQPAKKLGPRLAEALRQTPAEFIRRYDANKDGVLTPDEVPPFLKKNFERVDANGDGKLDQQEVAALLRRLRQRFGQAQAGKGAGANRAEVDRLVSRLLERFDTDKDGKISKDEAKGPLARNFDRLDTNKDGYLDKEELRRAASFLAARFGGGQGNGKRPAAERRQEAGAVPDFDALDLNADGRLTREELKGTPLADRFDAIDTNKDGKIDPKEFNAYFQRQAAKK